MKICPFSFHHLNYLTAWISHPPSLCLLFLLPLSHHCCLLAAHLLTLSPPSVRGVRRRSASLHQCGWRIPHLRLQPLSPGLHLGPPTLRLHPVSQLPRLHRRPSAHQLHQAPSSLRLRPGQSSPHLHLWTPLLRLRLVAPSLRLCGPPPSRGHSLGPLSLRLRRGPPDLRLRLGRQSLGLRLGPPDPRCRPGSSALRLRLGLYHHLLRLRRSAPWCRQPFLHHGSSLHRLHREVPSWLRSGSHLAPPAPALSCLLLGSSLHHHLLGLFRHHPGLHLLPSSRESVLRRSPLLGLYILFSCLSARGRAFREGEVMSHPWTV
ncbi:FMRFamide-related neuropeptide [Labeo rohita]|uniref:FMRFamide-related neuropeptide n=1 Tax=Labeo rohita TaxID=84645 RepID=A0ABQ8L753_LABRO|nr:FMRFamide-related neuropeptide [Labeo rohita]